MWIFSNLFHINLFKKEASINKASFFGLKITQNMIKIIIILL